MPLCFSVLCNHCLFFIFLKRKNIFIQMRNAFKANIIACLKEPVNYFTYFQFNSRFYYRLSDKNRL